VTVGGNQEKMLEGRTKARQRNSSFEYGCSEGQTYLGGISNIRRKPGSVASHLPLAERYERHYLVRFSILNDVEISEI